MSIFANGHRDAIKTLRGVKYKLSCRAHFFAVSVFFSDFAPSDLKNVYPTLADVLRITHACHYLSLEGRRGCGMMGVKDSSRLNVEMRVVPLHIVLITTVIITNSPKNTFLLLHISIIGIIVYTFLSSYIHHVQGIDFLFFYFAL